MRYDSPARSVGSLEEHGGRTLFQPVVRAADREIVGFQACCASGGDDPAVAHAAVSPEVEEANAPIDLRALASAWRRFAEQSLPGSLFHLQRRHAASAIGEATLQFLAFLREVGSPPSRLVLVFDDVSGLATDVSDLQATAGLCRSMGCGIALRVAAAPAVLPHHWIAMMPDYVCVASELARRAGDDSRAQAVLRKIADYGETLGTVVVAEDVTRWRGIETTPHTSVALRAGDDAVAWTGRPVRGGASWPDLEMLPSDDSGAASLPRCSACVPAGVSVGAAAAVMYAGGHAVLPVVEGGRPVGLLRSLDLLSRCMGDAKAAAVSVDEIVVRAYAAIEVTSTLSALRQRFLGGDLPLGDDPHVVIDPCGRYLGFIRAADLALRLAAPDTRHSPYANPLTGLPGGVPIGERIDALLHAGNMFVVANCDIEGIGAFNDASGYARGDEVIRFVADVVHRCIEPGTDFLGHIGGDDFIVIFQSADWFERCERMAQLCDLGAPDFYPPEAREGRGFYRYDRLHRRVFVPFFALSIGAVTVEPGRFASYHEIAAAGIEVRERAKLTRGGAIYIDERMYHAAAPGDAAKCYN